ncbi:MAG: hypothetical protein JSV68_16895 [Anaerolineaceae bacterium]|nr:MAG: hypothetical protein JSV68_16895 [Anaerolineaceae bacterium]
MKKFIIPVVLLLSFALVAAAYAANGYPWNDHAAPYDFLFGNHIDTHQQTQEIGKDQLAGFFYIKFTGEYVDGVPEAKHADCELDAVDCTVGWKLKGISAQATLLEKPEHGHPIWCIDPQDMPRSPGFSHFHWEGDPEHAGSLPDGAVYSGYLLKLTAQDRFFFNHHGGFLVTPGIDTETHANVVTDCGDE